MITTHAKYNSVWTYTVFDFVLLGQFRFDWVDYGCTYSRIEIKLYNVITFLRFFNVFKRFFKPKKVTFYVFCFVAFVFSNNGFDTTKQKRYRRQTDGQTSHGRAYAGVMGKKLQT